jgi:ATP-dependent Clp protease ATP-binding subunit ClpA
MISFADIIQLARSYYPGIRLHNMVPGWFRSLITIMGWLLLFVGGIASLVLFLGPTTGLDQSLLATIDPSQLADLSRQSLGILFMGLSMAAFASTMKFFENSYYFRGLRPMKWSDFSADDPHTTYEVAEILYKLHDQNDLVHEFLNSRYGHELVIRLGLEASFIQQVQTKVHVDVNTLQFEQIVNLTSFGTALLQQSDGLKDLLFTYGKTEQEYTETLSWIEDTLVRNKRRRRAWSRENLGKYSGIGKDFSFGYTRQLEKYARPIIEFPEFRNVRLDNPRGREEAEQIISILIRGRESNALLIGDEGSGKLDVLARIGKEIDEGTITPELEAKRIMIFDGDSLVAGTGNKVQFEQQLVSVFNEASRAGNIILAINNFPSFIQTALTLGSDVMSLLDPYLAAARLQIIGLSDSDLFYQVLEKNSKLMQRFNVVQMRDIDTDLSLALLKEYAEIIEHKRRVIFTYPALVAVAEAAERYITTGVMPDRALDLLAELPSQAEITKNKIITKDHVESLVTQKTGIPLGEVQEQETQKLLNLEEIMHQRVVGQEQAIVSIADTMRRSRSGIQNPNRPIGSFLFLGPTGVGKTEVSKTLADQIFGSDTTMMRFDMSEYKTADALDKLIGSFQTGQAGTLVTAVKKQPYGLLLLDEFEKSTDQVKDLFLQVLDEGVFADMRGKKVNARNTIIIATSNAGADLIWDYFQQGINPSERTHELVDEIISRGILKPELINRFDSVVVFQPLSPDNLTDIARLMLQKLQRRIFEQKRIQLQFANDVISMVAKEGSDPQFGARPMNRFIQDTLEKVIAKKIISGGISSGQVLSITAADLHESMS